MCTIPTSITEDQVDEPILQPLGAHNKLQL